MTTFRKILFLSFLFVSYTFHPFFPSLPFLPSAYAADSKDITPIEIHGDNVEYFYDQNKAVGTGNVKIDYRGWKLSADKVEVDMKSKEALASGNVTLEQEGAIYKGEEVRVNFETKSAEISKVRAAIAPYYFARGERVEKIGEEYYRISDGYVTTCDDTQCDDKEVPYYRIQAKEVLYYPDDKLVIKHAVLRIGNVPFFYIPYLVIPILDVDRFPLEVEVGRRKEWGAYALTRYRYYINPSASGNILFDVREKQKLAGGIEHFYDTHAFGEGAARFYYADDRCGEDDLDCSPNKSRLVDETSRFRAQARHRWQMFDDTALNLEMNKLSDPYVIQDFFSRREYERTGFPDNYLSVIHSKDDYTVSVLNRWRMDDFTQVVERTPELRIDTHTHVLGDTPFYWRQEAQAGRLNRTYDNEDQHDEAVRADLRHTLSYVWRLDPVTITPYIGARETYYSRDLAGDDDGGRDFVRANMESGVDASTKFFKVYDTTIKAFGLDINQIRHIVTPSVRYRYQSKPTHVQETLYPFDRIDSLDHENFFRFDLENKLQTKYRAPDGTLANRDLVRTIVYADLATPQGNRSRLERVGLDFELDPYPWLTIASDAQYAFEPDNFETANLDIVFNRDPVWIGFGQRYVNSESNQTTAQVDWKINDIWSVRVYERFEFGGNETDEFEVTVERRNFFCWTVRLTFNYRNGPNFYVSFSPTAYPESVFQSGQYYRRDKPTIPTSGILTSADY